ncbi:MAG: NAD-dependent epimerase/dehydratase family protein [Cytophagales bacterium]|nr:NAD-dependent epimerase/dehydratase family protein [Cytophagales bacterium]
MKVLILGGTGLISRTITEHLLHKKDIEITHFNRGLKTTTPPGVKTIVGDRTNYISFERQMEEADRYDVVIDMIGYHPDEVSSAIRTFKGRVKQYIFCSTVDIYPKWSVKYPITEAEPLEASPAFEYAYNKVKCEKLLWQAHEQKCFEVTCIRPAHTYGEGGNILHTLGWDNTYLPDRMKKNKKIICHGDGTSLWGSAHAHDVGKAFANAVGNIKTYGEGYHVAADEWITWNYYYTQMAESMGYDKPEMVYIPSNIIKKLKPDTGFICDENFKYSNVFDNTKAHKDLGYTYTISWKEGIKRTILWLEKEGKIQNSDQYPEYDDTINKWDNIINKL